MRQIHLQRLGSPGALARWIAVALAAVMCLGSFPAYATESGILNAKVVLRQKADANSKALQTLPEGDEVTLLDTSGKWYKVSYGKYTGYVMKKYVKTGKNSVVANQSKIEALGDAPGALRIGNSGRDVTKLQKALDILGYYDGRIDGDYGAGTTAAVMAYQEDQGLEADGVAGKTTIASLFGSCAKKADIDSTATTASTSGSSSTTAQSTSKSSGKTVSSLSEIGGAPAASKEGDSGSKVTKLQQALEFLGYYTGEIDGSYGAKTVEAVKRFQKNRGMKQDGVAGASTLRVMFGGTTASTKSATDASASKLKTEVLDWFKDRVTNLIPKNAKFTIKDIRTGKTFQAIRWSGGNHIDAEPLTSSDTKTMKSIYGGSWSWDRRPILIQCSGHVYAASMNGMPHGDDIFKGNDFEGVFCIHFKNSKTHGSDKVDPDHQSAITTAGKASW